MYYTFLLGLIAKMIACDVFTFTGCARFKVRFDYRVITRLHWMNV